MSFCQSCGANVGESAFCPHCGYSIHGQPPAYAQPPVQYILKPMTPDAPSKGIAWISFFFPLVGLILYLVYHDTKPMKAASAGKGALWGVLTPIIVVLVLSLVIGVIYMFYSAQGQKKQEFRSYKTESYVSTTTHRASNIPDANYQERPEL